MKNYSAKEIKNIVLIGAPGSGKTTLAEAMAFEGKVIDRRGSVETNNTLSDNTDIEHEYKRSIYATILFTEFMDRKLNIIDCPGSDDFCGNLFSAFKVGDVGVFLINAQNGWEVGSEIQARYARLLDKPLIGVVNQLDAEKANFEATIESIRAASRVKPVIVQYPVNQGPEFNAFIDVLLMKMYRFQDENGRREELDIPADEMERAEALNKELVEMAAEHDEALMELYFDKGTLTQDDIRAGLKIGVANREIMPVFCASGKRDIGTKRLMEFIINVAPGPLKAHKFLSTEGEEIAADENGPAVAFVFKSQIEQHIGEISYFRVIRGRLTEGTELINTRTGNKEKISQLFAVAGKNRIKVTELSAGDIGCTVKLKGTRTNDTLAAASAPVSVEPIAFPEPRYRAAVKAKNQSDEEKLGKLLGDAKYEDPTILVEYSKELKQTIIQGQGEHHLNILKNRLAAENKMEIEYFAPRIPYRETITKVAQADYRHKKQSGGSGQFGEVHMIIEPYYEGMPDPKTYKLSKGEITVNVKGKEEYDLPWGGKLLYYNAIVGGAIDARFMPAILKGVMEKMDEGPLTGSYARDIRVVIYDGKMHPVDSNEISFKLAARNAFKEAFRNAGPKIMEPIYSVEVLTPSEYMGAVMSDLQNRRAMIEGMESDKGFDRLNARVPLAELYRYSTTLSSLTSGSATYSMRLASYEQVPADVQEKLLKAYTDTDEE
ncbi:translation factor GTPase family protein [Alistipes sp.]|jgi:translation elongation factor 2 (EF-2/EF-G)|uniref:elongation factor G n=1 Tax=Alistipes sp. TaxID=1872444 RepID=UPI001DAA0655|nr:elongation factor G [Alistipes sp.]MBS6099812.1 elongation factor G [Alistipes sp.]HJI19429.1 elongation factor G [Rikenellaceae bacterium]